MNCLNRIVALRFGIRFIIISVQPRAQFDAFVFRFGKRVNPKNQTRDRNQRNQRKNQPTKRFASGLEGRPVWISRDCFWVGLHNITARAQV